MAEDYKFSRRIYRSQLLPISMAAEKQLYMAHLDSFVQAATQIRGGCSLGLMQISTNMMHEELMNDRN